MTIEPTILNIVFLQKELPKKYGLCVLMFWRMECQFPKIKLGIKDLNKLMKDLERMEREF